MKTAKNISIIAISGLFCISIAWAGFYISSKPTTVEYVIFKDYWKRTNVYFHRAEYSVHIPVWPGGMKVVEIKADTLKNFGTAPELLTKELRKFYSEGEDFLADGIIADGQRVNRIYIRNGESLLYIYSDYNGVWSEIKNMTWSEFANQNPDWADWLNDKTNVIFF